MKNKYLLLIGTLLFSNTLVAGVLTYNFTGTFNNVDNDPFNEFVLGEQFSGSFSVEDTASVSTINAPLGAFDQTTYRYGTFEVNTSAGTSRNSSNTYSNSIRVWDDALSTFSSGSEIYTDRFIFTAFFVDTPYQNVEFFQLDLRESSFSPQIPSFIDGDIANISQDLTERATSMRGRFDRGTWGDIYFSIDSLILANATVSDPTQPVDPVQVSEPSYLSLLCIGALSIIRLRRQA